MNNLGNTGSESHARGIAKMDSRQLLKLAQDTTPKGRYTLAGAVSDFFENDALNQMEHRLVVEIMMQLIRQAEIDLREALAERLAVFPNVPPEVVIFLANDEISVARPILRHSTVLNDVDLVYIISSKGADYWRSIAQRAHISPAVAGRLIDTGDAGTAINMLENPQVNLPKSGMKRLVKTALKHEKLQEALLRRPEVDGDLATDLYGCVSQALRREIAKRFSVRSASVEAALDGLVEELCREAKSGLCVTPEMTALAARFNERGEITPNLMIRTLRRGQVSFFVALFAVKMGLKADGALRVMRQEGGKSFAFSCRAIGMMKSEFASIYLLSHAARSEEKIVDPRTLADALKYFDAARESEIASFRKELSRNPDLI